jgi:hypothetical protein
MTVVRTLLTSEARVRAGVSPGSVCAEKWDWDRFFLKFFSFYPVNIMSLWLSILKYNLEDKQ